MQKTTGRLLPFCYSIRQMLVLPLPAQAQQSLLQFTLDALPLVARHEGSIGGEAAHPAQCSQKICGAVHIGLRCFEEYGKSKQSACQKNNGRENNHREAMPVSVRPNLSYLSDNSPYRWRDVMNCWGGHRFPGQWRRNASRTSSTAPMLMALSAMLK